MATEFLAPVSEPRELGDELVRDVIGDDLQPSGPPNYLSVPDLPKLQWDRFEALAAFLQERNGATVILTPRAGDEGVDVISFRRGEFCLVQCKHTRSDSQIDADTIAELLQAIDGYRLRHLRKYRGVCRMRPVLFTNARLSKQMAGVAKQKDITVLDAKEINNLLQRFPCTASDIERMNSRRLLSMPEVQMAIASIADRVI
jgi:Holliday junction resolvase